MQKKMNIYNLDIYNRALFYAEYLILKPLLELSFDDYDKKQFSDLICNNLKDGNKFTQQMASDFGHYTKNWNFDWHWIAHHIIWDNYNLRLANEIENRRFGEDQIVYKDNSTDKNIEYNKLYLTDPNDDNSQPKLFKLKELIRNGTNIGLDKSNWKPTIGITDFGFYEYHPYDDETNEIEMAHYFDNSSLMTLPNGYEWNREKKEFELVQKPLTERQKKIRSLVKITITKTDK